MSFKKEVMSKLGKIEDRLVEQHAQLAVNNKILDEHHKRSTMLEERILPLERSHVFSNKLSTSIAYVVGLLASMAAVYHYLLK